MNTYITMNFLSIDCSTDPGSLFIKAKNKTFSKILQNNKFNNDLLMKQILDFFKINNLILDDISLIFVNQGPGSFSGLRTSLAIAKGISLSKNLNLFGYNTFLWSCAKFFNKKDNIYSFIKFNDHYFVKKFDKKLGSNLIIEKINIEEIIKKYSDKFKVISKKDIKYFDEKILKLNNINVVDLDHRELELLKIRGLMDEKFIKPLYIS